MGEWRRVPSAAPGPVRPVPREVSRALRCDVGRGEAAGGAARPGGRPARRSVSPRSGACLRCGATPRAGLPGQPSRSGLQQPDGASPRPSFGRHAVSVMRTMAMAPVAVRRPRLVPGSAGLTRWELRGDITLIEWIVGFTRAFSVAIVLQLERLLTPSAIPPFRTAARAAPLACTHICRGPHPRLAARRACGAACLPVSARSC